MLTLGEIAERLGLVVEGDSSFLIAGLAPLESAGAQHLGFVSKSALLPRLASSQAGAVIIKPEWAEHWRGNYLVSENPYLDFARATHLFDNRPLPSGRVHERATVSPSAQLGSDVTVDAGAVIDAGAVLGEGVWIGANVHIGQDSHIGAHTRIYPGVAIYYGVRIGSHCTVHANAIIGSDGFGFAPSDGGWVKILQLGSVQIGDRVDVGAGATIDRGALGDTVIEDNAILDNQVHIAHNVRVGTRTGMAACAAVAGSTDVGKDCTLAGMVGVGDHLVIADNVHVAGQGRVTRSLTEPGLYASGTPIQPYREWSKNAVRFEHLADMAKRLKALEKQLAECSQISASKEGDPS